MERVRCVRITDIRDGECLLPFGCIALEIGDNLTCNDIVAQCLPRVHASVKTVTVSETIWSLDSDRVQVHNADMKLGPLFDAVDRAFGTKLVAMTIQVEVVDMDA